MPTPADLDQRVSAFLADVRRCANAVVRSIAEPRPASVAAIVAELVPVPPGVHAGAAGRRRDDVVADVLARTSSVPKLRYANGDFTDPAGGAR
jgi:hypothetical protein